MNDSNELNNSIVTNTACRLRVASGLISVRVLTGRD